MVFAFGGSQHERIEVDVERYEAGNADVDDYWDANWLTVQIKVRAGGFSGKAHASLHAPELLAFLEALRPIGETLKGSAEFRTIEEQLELNLKGDGKGAIELQGEVADAPGIGNRLRFTLCFDQTQLAQSIQELAAVLKAFPVRGD